MKDKELVYKRKWNMKLYSLHKALSADFLFYYAVKFLFLNEVKGLTTAEILIGTAVYGLCLAFFQIPSTLVLDRYGDKKGIILGDLFIALGSIVFIFSNNLFIYLISRILVAFGVSLKDLGESAVLNKSIPSTEKKNKIFAAIDGKGLGGYYYISALTAGISGFLYNINPYIPMILCSLVSLISFRVAFLFEEIEVKETKKEKKEKKENLIERYRESYRENKLAFKFIFTSSRLKALMLYSGLMYSMLQVMLTYELGHLSEIKLSASVIGVTYAIMQILSGFAARHQNTFHNAFRNKSLSVLGLIFTISIMFTGIFSLTTLPYGTIVAVVMICYMLRSFVGGTYYVLIKKYLANFTNTRMLKRVYASYGLVTGISNIAICLLAALIVTYNSISYSMIIFGLISTVAMFAVLYYMNDRVGLKPEEYNKKDISLSEYAKINGRG